MSERRDHIKTVLLDSLTSPVGCGSDLLTGEQDGEWLEIIEGRLDLDHLVSEVEALIEEALDNE